VRNTEEQEGSDSDFETVKTDKKRVKKPIVYQAPVQVAVNPQFPASDPTKIIIKEKVAPVKIAEEKPAKVVAAPAEPIKQEVVKVAEKVAEKPKETTAPVKVEAAATKPAEAPVVEAAPVKKAAAPAKPTPAKKVDNEYANAMKAAFMGVQASPAPEVKAAAIDAPAPVKPAAPKKEASSAEQAPAPKKKDLSEIDCKFGLKCTRKICAFRHPAKPAAAPKKEEAPVAKPTASAKKETPVETKVVEEVKKPVAAPEETKTHEKPSRGGRGGRGGNTAAAERGGRGSHRGSNKPRPQTGAERPTEGKPEDKKQAQASKSSAKFEDILNAEETEAKKAARRIRDLKEEAKKVDQNDFKAMFSMAADITDQQDQKKKLAKAARSKK